MRARSGRAIGRPPCSLEGESREARRWTCGVEGAYEMQGSCERVRFDRVPDLVLLME